MYSNGLKNILKIIYCCFLKLLTNFYLILILGVTYPVHLLQYFATKVTPKIKINSIIILDLKHLQYNSYLQKLLWMQNNAEI